MQSVARFRVVSSFLAVRLSAHREHFVTVPVGAIIKTSSELQDPGLVTVSVDGDTLLAFHRDIIERSERVEDSLVQRSEGVEDCSLVRWR